MCGRSAGVSELRIWWRGNLEAEASAEIESGGTERMSGDGCPEIELVASAVTVEALEEVARDVHREGGIVWRTGRS